MLPRQGAPETCAELVFATAGGETGGHLGAIVAPLLIHDLPVALWWPGDPPFGTRLADDLIGMADRLVVDGSRWSGDGLDRLRALAALARLASPSPTSRSCARRAGARPWPRSSTSRRSCRTCPPSAGSP